MEVISDVYDYIKTTLVKSYRYICPPVNTTLKQFGFYLTLYCILCYIVYVVSAVFRNRLSKLKYFDSNAKRVLLVIAHPDDECMFFGPLIVRLMKSQNCVIYLLCLSSGDSQKKGHLRKRELLNSCQVLGIPMENVFLCCSSLRLDGDEYMWKSDTIAALIHDYIEQFEIDTVVTFDKQGVSGHSNHIALFRGVSYLSLRKWLPLDCKIFLLDSLSLMRKYSSLMDCAISLYTSEHVFILSPQEHEQVKKAMRMHKTQLNWYRKLYMCFSRYTYINSFIEMSRYREYT